MQYNENESGLNTFTNKKLLAVSNVLTPKLVSNIKKISSFFDSKEKIQPNANTETVLEQIDTNLASRLAKAAQPQKKTDPAEQQDKLIVQDLLNKLYEKDSLGETPDDILEKLSKSPFQKEILEGMSQRIREIYEKKYERDIFYNKQDRETKAAINKRKNKEGLNKRIDDGTGVQSRLSAIEKMVNSSRQKGQSVKDLRSAWADRDVGANIGKKLLFKINPLAKTVNGLREQLEYYTSEKAYLETKIKGIASEGLLTLNPLPKKYRLKIAMSSLNSIEKHIDNINKKLAKKGPSWDEILSMKIQKLRGAGYKDLGNKSSDEIRYALDKKFAKQMDAKSTEKLKDIFNAKINEISEDEGVSSTVILAKLNDYGFKLDGYINKYIKRDPILTNNETTKEFSDNLSKMIVKIVQDEQNEQDEQDNDGSITKKTSTFTKSLASSTSELSNLISGDTKKLSESSQELDDVSSEDSVHLARISKQIEIISSDIKTIKENMIDEQDTEIKKTSAIETQKEVKTEGATVEKKEGSSLFDGILSFIKGLLTSMLGSLVGMLLPAIISALVGSAKFIWSMLKALTKGITLIAEKLITKAISGLKYMYSEIKRYYNVFKKWLGEKFFGNKDIPDVPDNKKDKKSKKTSGIKNTPDVLDKTKNIHTMDIKKPGKIGRILSVIGIAGTTGATMGAGNAQEDAKSIDVQKKTSKISQTPVTSQTGPDVKKVSNDTPKGTKSPQWEKLKKFITSKFKGKVGQKIIASFSVFAAGLMTGPGALITTIISVGLTVWAIYDIITIAWEAVPLISDWLASMGITWTASIEYILSAVSTVSGKALDIIKSIWSGVKSVGNAIADVGSVVLGAGKGLLNRFTGSDKGKNDTQSSQGAQANAKGIDAQSSIKTLEQFSTLWPYIWHNVYKNREKLLEKTNTKDSTTKSNASNASNASPVESQDYKAFTQVWPLVWHNLIKNKELFYKSIAPNQQGTSISNSIPVAQAQLAENKNDGFFGRMINSGKNIVSKTGAAISNTVSSTTESIADTFKKIKAFIGKGFKTQSGVDYQGTNETVKKNFEMMAAEYNMKTGRTIQINSGYRSLEEQTRLYNDYKSGRSKVLAGAPGGSLHNFGYALDINSGEANEMAAMGLLDKYGFHRPLLAKGETWHIEPKNINKEQLKKQAQPKIEHTKEAEAKKNTQSPIKGLSTSASASSGITSDPAKDKKNLGAEGVSTGELEKIKAQKEAKAKNNKNETKAIWVQNNKDQKTQDALNVNSKLSKNSAVINNTTIQSTNVNNAVVSQQQSRSTRARTTFA